MVHLQLMGIQQDGVPLPSDAVEEPVFPYLHESRHLHALRRARGGRFLNSKENENKLNDAASGDKSQSNINLNSDKTMQLLGKC
ncbi:putative germin-like protein 2-1-like [Hibiscus syriacus]|uniref:Nuclear transcription factor Y subunit n=1 Tax=Hibiscus syriacus TaxID=106335 RepID=A0A6A2WAZ4_HIBSY|nr:putative germin-like protein 2-1-like [Hibiscus syriacus]